MNTEREHAELSASGAHRWANCTASYLMERDLPDSTSAYAERGTYLHKKAYDLLVTDGLPLFKNYSLDGLNIDEKHAVKSYVKFVKDLGGTCLIEQKVDFSHIVPGGFGTVDACVVKDNKLTIVDLKTGQGIQVHAEANYQLILYALGALRLDAIKQQDIETIELVIHQAITEHVDSWKISKDKLLEYGDFLSKQAHQALDTNSLEFTPTKSTCQFCKAKGVCKAYMNYSVDMVKKGFKNLSLEPHKLSSDEIARVLAKASVFSNWVEAVKAEARDRLYQGDEIEGYTLAEGTKRRTWANPAEIEAFLRQKRIRVKDFFVRKFISPAQAERLLKDKNININDFIRVTTGEPRVVEAKHNTKAFKDAVIEGFENVA